jgi:hypothetical protein
MGERPSGTSAAQTAFCAVRIEGPGGMLWVDGNGKITAGKGSLEDPNPNAFSLVHIEDCPGSTAICRASCYVHGLEKNAPGTYAFYRHNSQMIRKILVNLDAAAAWARILGQWISQRCPQFRWHVSGDVFSRSYAEWIVKVCRSSLTTDHWIYLRSFQFLDILFQRATVRGGNLAINLSCDAENYAEGRRLADTNNLRVCYLTTDGEVPNDLRDGDVIFPDYNLRGGNAAGAAWFMALEPRYKAMVCPVDFHGKSERRRCGPCSRCMK